MIKNFYKGLLIVSNQYNYLCELYQIKHTQNNNIIKIKQAKNIVNIIIKNAAQQYKIPEIILIGADDISIWETNTKILIDYIQSINKETKIILQIEEEHNITDNMFEFLKQNHINVNYYISDFKNINTNIFKIKNLTTFFLMITPQNYQKIYDNYLLFSNQEIKKIKFLFNNLLLNKNEIKTIENQLKAINNYIYNSFQNFNIPLIPHNFNTYFIKVLLKDMEDDIKTQFLSTQDLILKHCNILTGEKIIINQNGELFLCSPIELDKNNQFYCGKINNEQIIENNNLLKYNNLTNFVFNNINPNNFKYLPHQNTNICYKDCALTSTCAMDCFANNIINTNKNFINEPCDNYCEIQNILFKLTENLILKLDCDKNELFKQYFYSVISKGLFDI